MIRILHLFLPVLFVYIFCVGSWAQNSLIQVESNKVVGIFNFLETATRAAGTSSSYRNLIIQNLGSDTEFDLIIQRYNAINTRYFLHREAFPESRKSFKTTKDFIWIACTNAKDIDDLNERIIGFLPHNDHVDFIQVMKDIEPYYTTMIWDVEQKNLSTIKHQLSFFVEEIDSLYRMITHFYGAEWDESIPFKVILYPIPLDSGVSTSIAEGNALICSFLSKHELDYINVLGVIVHEMCHILYEAQPLEIQHQLSGWFDKSQSKFKKLASFYADEGLATAIGNGWAFQQIHGRIDTNEWYSNEYINGYAHEIFTETKLYLESGKTIDEDFIHIMISSFERKFPTALYRTKTLLYDHYLFANGEDEKSATEITDVMHQYFRIASQYMSTPIDDPESKVSFNLQETTKIFVVEKYHASSVQLLNSNYIWGNIPESMNSLYGFIDKETNSVIIVIQVQDMSKLHAACKKLLEMRTMRFGEIIGI